MSRKATPRPGTPAAVLDPWTLVELVSYGRGRGDQALRELITGFAIEARQRIAALGAAVAAGDLAAAAGVAHALRGASSSVAATALADCCRHVEESARRGDPTGARRGAEQLDCHLQQASSALHRVLFGAPVDPGPAAP